VFLIGDYGAVMQHQILHSQHLIMRTVKDKAKEENPETIPLLGVGCAKSGVA
jgi:hypothetical protein